MAIEKTCPVMRVQAGKKKGRSEKNSHLPGKPGTRKQLLPLLPFGPDGVGSASATRLRLICQKMAERRGFEPPVPVKVHTLSRRAP